MRNESKRGPFEGRVSVVMDTKGRIALRKDDTGKFTIPKDADKLFAKMRELADEHDTEMVVFAPDGLDADLARPIVMQKYSSVYMGYLKHKARKTGPRVQKLA